MQTTKLWIAALAFWLTASASQSSQTATGPDAIKGFWITSEKDEVEIYEKNGKYYARVIKLAQPLDENGKPWTDQLNPNKNLREQPIVGIDVLTGLTYDRKNEWDGGKVYEVEDGKFYDCELELKKDGRLKVSGCVSFYCDSEYWTRKK